MRTLSRHSLLALFCLLVTPTESAVAQNSSASHVLQITVAEINEISLTSSPRVVGAKPATDTGATTVTSLRATYAVTTNSRNAAIVAALENEPAEGVVVRVRFAAPAGAQSAGWVTLGAWPVTVATGVRHIEAAGLVIDYEVQAPADRATVETPSIAVSLHSTSEP